MGPEFPFINADDNFIFSTILLNQPIVSALSDVFTGFAEAEAIASLFIIRNLLNFCPSV